MRMSWPGVNSHMQPSYAAHGKHGRQHQFGGRPGSIRASNLSDNRLDSSNAGVAVQAPLQVRSGSRSMPHGAVNGEGVTGNIVRN